MILDFALVPLPPDTIASVNHIRPGRNLIGVINGDGMTLAFLVCVRHRLNLPFADGGAAANTDGDPTFPARRRIIAYESVVNSASGEPPSGVFFSSGMTTVSFGCAVVLGAAGFLAVVVLRVYVRFGAGGFFGSGLGFGGGATYFTALFRRIQRLALDAGSS